MELVNEWVLEPFFELFNWLDRIVGMAAGHEVEKGWVTVIFTVLFRIFWLPVSMASTLTKKERVIIIKKIESIKKIFAQMPVRQKEELKKLMNSNQRIRNASIINLCGHMILIWLFYHITTEITFKTCFGLNLLLMAEIFLTELVSGWLSPFPVDRTQLTTMIVMPLLGLMVLAHQPTGVKLLVITTLGFTIGIMLIKLLKRIYDESKSRLNQAAYGLILTKNNQEEK